MKNRVILVLLFAGVTPLLAAQDMEMIHSAKQAVREMKASSAKAGIRIQGTLICPMAESNDGSACTVQMREAKSGKVFRLENNAQALQYFHQGTRNVTIEGELLDLETLAIANISTLSN